MPGLKPIKDGRIRKRRINLFLIKSYNVYLQVLTQTRNFKKFDNYKCALRVMGNKTSQSLNLRRSKDIIFKYF